MTAAASQPMMPVYGFVQGDTMGLVVLVRRDETARDLANRLIEAAGIRVDPPGDGRVMVGQRILDPKATLRSEGIGPLDRVDLVWR